MNKNPNIQRKVFCERCPGESCPDFKDKNKIHKITTPSRVFKDCLKCINDEVCDRSFKYHKHSCLGCYKGDCDESDEKVIHSKKRECFKCNKKVVRYVIFLKYSESYCYDCFDKGNIFEKNTYLMGSTMMGN